MAKEIREIIAFQKQLAEGDPVRWARLDDLQNVANHAEETGALSKNLQEAAFEKTILDYKRGPLTPDLVTNYWRAKLPDLNIPECDWTAKEIRRPMKDITGKNIPGILVPVTDKMTIFGLSRRFPRLKNDEIDISASFTNIHDTTGYVKIESSIYPPNRDTSHADLEAFAEKQGYLPARLLTYILASQASKDFTGAYLDEELSESRLLGSCNISNIYAWFTKGGHLGIYGDVNPEISDINLGGRFEEVKKV